MSILKVKCPVCKGKKERMIESHQFGATFIYLADCDYCGATGKVSRGALYKKKRKR